MTTSCAGAKAGVRFIVDAVGPIAVVTGIIANEEVKLPDISRGAALLLNAAGNIDRARTTDGTVYHIESTLAMDAAEAARDGRRRREHGGG